MDDDTIYICTIVHVLCSQIVLYWPLRSQTMFDGAKGGKINSDSCVRSRQRYRSSKR